MKATERTVLDALRTRFTKNPGNGERYVLAEHVRDEAYARRTADLLVRDTWASSGHALHGFEVKVSRSDWLAELKDPTKAERFKVHCDYWWLAVSDAKIVKDDLPPGWGLMVMSGDDMRIVRSAPRLHPLPMSKGMAVMLERAIAKTSRRHITLDVEADRPLKCDRYKAPWDCARAHVNPCWNCRANSVLTSRGLV